MYRIIESVKLNCEGGDFSGIYQP